jgi:hypothetical protein
MRAPNFTIAAGVAVFMMASGATCFSQRQTVRPPAPPAVKADTYRHSAAFAELRLKKAELEAAAESLAETYTDEFPKLAEMRFAVGAVDREIGRLAAVRNSSPAILSSALGKLMIRKAELETEKWALLRNLASEHPDVKRMNRRIEIFESAIREVLDQ